ncbi:MAG: (4Fe-4S)-binding protein [Bacteroidetes bacterium]|nr:(4Fe-4S)-binding protein [Bacteroidota bacterium]
MKKIRYFTNASGTIKWDEKKCEHSGKCLENMLPPQGEPSSVPVEVSDKLFETMKTQSSLCPSGALCLVIK